MEKVEPGHTYSLQATGKVILPVYKGQANYLVMKNNATDIEYDDSKIFFALE
ncbi:hypothetical protein D3C86_2101290 [compost metagenome]